MKRPMGKPRIFKTEEEFYNAIIDYFEYCEETERFPNIAGAVVHMGIGRTTFYEYEAKYPNTFKLFQDILEDNVLQSRDTTTKIFYLKNKFGYRDRIETENTNINNNTNKNIDFGHLSKEDIKELLRNES